MSYGNMWEPDPPSPAEKLSEAIRAGGGSIVKKRCDVPSEAHWSIVCYEIFHATPVTLITYLKKDDWIDAVKKLAMANEHFSAFAAKPVTAKLEVVVDVDVQEMS